MSSKSETKFVNSLFLTNLIQSQLGESFVKIKTYTVEPATGETLNKHARSSIRRILVTYSSKETANRTISLVAKIKPEHGPLAEEFKKSEVFEMETQIYTSILPKIAQITGKLGRIEMAPSLIQSLEFPFKMILLEDMSLKGFGLENQQMGLNLQQSKVTLEKLAFLHAASAVLISEQPNDFSKFSKGTFHPDFKNKLAFYHDAIKAVADNAKSLGIDEKLSEKLDTLPVKTIQKAIEEYTSNFENLQVLNHGDFWTNNILFKYEGLELVDVIFVDFQNCVVGSPIMDLSFFLATSVAYNVLETSKDELLYTYYETLRLLLVKFGYKNYTPTTVEFQIEYLKRSALEVIYAITVSPYLRTKVAENYPPIIPSLYKEDKNLNLKTILQIQVHKDFIKQQLKEYDSKGLLDWGQGHSKIKKLMNRFQR